MTITNGWPPKNPKNKPPIVWPIIALRISFFSKEGNYNQKEKQKEMKRKRLREIWREETELRTGSKRMRLKNN